MKYLIVVRALDSSCGEDTAVEKLFERFVRGLALAMKRKGIDKHANAVIFSHFNPECWRVAAFIRGAAVPSASIHYPQESFGVLEEHIENVPTAINWLTREAGTREAVFVVAKREVARCLPWQFLRRLNGELPEPGIADMRLKPVEMVFIECGSHEWEKVSPKSSEEVAAARLTELRPVHR